jgi:hypothetical protein
MASAIKPPADSAPDESPGATLRSILSLAIVLHFICVLTVLGSTYRRSRLQARLVGIFGPYTQLLAFDPGFFTPYYYTQGRTSDDDAIITADLYADADRSVDEQEAIAKTALPEGGSRWLTDRRRAIALARQLALYADPENEADELSGEIARAIGSRLLREHGARRAVVRCTRRLSQPLDLSTLFPGFPPNDPTAAQYDELLYEADVWIDEDGEVQVQKRVAAAEAAPRRTSPASRRVGISPAQESAAPAREGEAPAEPRGATP